MIKKLISNWQSLSIHGAFPAANIRPLED